MSVEKPRLVENKYRMKQLSELSGVSRETIRYYINEGLLPPPVKTSKNMGWYSDRHLDILQLIQKLQKERFLPLKVIKPLIHGDEVKNLDESQRKLLEEVRKRLVSDHRDLVVSEDPAQLADEMRLSKVERREFIQLGLSKKGVVTVSDVEIARLWMQIRDVAGLLTDKGVSPKHLKYLIDIVDEAVGKELTIFRKTFKSLSPEEAEQLLDVVVPAISKMFSILHIRRITEHVEAVLESEEVNSR